MREERPTENPAPTASPLLDRTRVWKHDYGLTALLVMLVVTLFVVTPLAGSAAIGSVIVLIARLISLEILGRSRNEGR